MPSEGGSKMRNILKRATALFLCVVMLLGVMPVSLAKEYVSPGFVLTSDEEGTEEDIGAGETFEAHKGGYVSVSIKTESANVSGKNSEYIGQSFGYYGTVSFQLRESWKYHDAGITNLFTSYDDATLRLKAPEGIVLLSAEGTPLPVDEEGYITVLSETVAAPSSGSVEKTFALKAVMTGNGRTANNTSYPALTVAFDTKVMVCGTNEDDPQTEHHIAYTDLNEKSNDTAMTGIADGDWTVRKAAETSEDARVRKSGENIILTYYIDTGRKVNNLPSSESSSYKRYGMIDLASFTLTDSVAEVKDKNNNTVYPLGIAVTYDNGSALPEGSCLIHEGNTGFTLTADSLKTADASAFDAGTVKAYTRYKVQLTYPAANFTWALSDPDPKLFDFTDAASISYTNKDDPAAGKNASSDATISWRGMAGGGNVSVSEKFFENATDETGEPFSELYQALFGAGETGIVYKLYIVTEEDGKKIIHNGPNDWSKTLSLKAGQNGTVSTAGGELNNMIPAGKIAIVPEYEGNVDLTWVTPVSGKNGDAPANIIVTVEEGKTAPAVFGLRFIDGGFVDALKTLSDDGASLQNGAALKDTKFVFTLDGSEKSVTMTIGTDGTGSVALRPGHYSVVETAPEGYAPVAFPDGITVLEGQTVKLGSGNIVNYPAAATLTVSGKMTDTWFSGDAAATDAGATGFSDGNITFMVQREQPKEGGTEWVNALSEAVSLSDGTVNITLPRYDEKGALIKYRVTAVSDGERTRFGSILDGSSDGMSSEVNSVFFTFPDTELKHSTVWYYQKFASILVRKTVNDARSNPSGVSGWPIVLSWTEGNTNYSSEVTRTGNDGTVEFTHLKKTDSAGEYITYTVTESEQADVWAVSYTTGGETGNQVTFSKTLDQGTVDVENKFLVGTLVLTKADADKNTVKLPNAQYRIFIQENGTKKYVTAATDSFGLRTFSENEAEAAAFTTGSDGKLTVQDLPCGMTYYAEETAAPEGYLINGEPVAFAAISSTNLMSSATQTDTKFPTLQIRKLSTDLAGNAVSVAKDNKAEFDLFVMNEAGTLSRAKDAAGNEVSFTAKWTKDGTEATSGTVTLPAYGTYYLLETSQSARLLSPAEQKVTGQSYYTDENTGLIYFGPIDIQAKENGKQNVTVYSADDAVNTATLKVAKYNVQDDTEPLKSAFTYAVMAQVKSTDTDTVSMLGNGWSASAPTSVAASDIPEPADGYVWYYSAAQTSASVAGLPVKDSESKPIVYRVLELTPPAGFYNKVNPDGSQGNTVSDPATLAAGTAYTYSSSLSDLPIVKVDARKRYKKVWEIVTEKESDIVSYYQTGVTLALYHVNNEGVLDDAPLASVETSGKLANALFDSNTLKNKALDYREKYVIVETDSNGFDTWYKTGTDYGENGKTGGEIKQGDSIPLTLSGLEAGHYNYQVLDLSSLTPENDTETCTLYNYVPYFQIHLTKYGYKVTESKNENSEVTYTRELLGNLDMAKFNLYAIPAAEYANYSGPADAIANNPDCTDGYVYETGMNGKGQFTTVNLPYKDDVVYILYESQIPDGYSIPAEGRSEIGYDGYIVIKPKDYRTADNKYQNGIYNVVAENDTYPGDGGGSVRYFRVELNKYVHVASPEEETVKYDPETDYPLADVTFKLLLCDNKKNLVYSDPEADPFNTFFTTGTDAATSGGDPSFGISETFKINKSVIKGIADQAGDDINDVITFYYCTYEDPDTHKRTYDSRTYSYDEFMGAESETDPNGLLLKNFDYKFKLVLIESDYPSNVIPYDDKYYLDIMTNGNGVYVDKTYTCNYETRKGNPILNAEGQYVLAQVQKYIDPDTAWTPADDNDYVTFRFEFDKYTEASSKPAIQSFDIRIDKTNYTALPAAYLSPNAKYYVSEIHAPKGYDKDPDNIKSIETGNIQTRVSDNPDERVQKIKMIDTPYITFTVTKKNSAGKAVSGQNLKLIYSSGDNADTILDANRKELTAGVSGVTDEKGQVTFTVPEYDYRAATANKIDYSCDTVAEYQVIELDADNARVSGFDLINGSITTVAADEANGQNITVVNPETADMTVLKVGVRDVTAPLAGVKFQLNYAPFRDHSEYLTMPTEYPSGMSTTLIDTYYTGADGTISLEDLSSGYYLLTEYGIPDGYMYETGRFSMYFALLTPGDAASLKLIDSAFTPGDSVKILKTDVTVDNVSKTADNNKKQYNTVTPSYEDGTLTLTVRNTHKGALDIRKLFAENTAGVTVPDTVRYIVRDANSDSAADVSVGISNNKGSALETLEDYIWLEPGTYTVIEETAPAQSWFATAKIEGSTDSGNDKGETLITPSAMSGNTWHSVKNVVITAANAVYTAEGGNTVTKPVTVSFTNCNAKMRLIAHKVDDDRKEPQPVADAGFIVFHTDDSGNEWYYKEIDSAGMGSWTKTVSEATVFTTNAEGLLTVDFIADFKQIQHDIGPASETDPALQVVSKYSIREIYADERYRELVPDKEYTFTAGQTVDLTGDCNNDLVDGLGLYIDLTLHGRTFAHATDPDDTKETPLVQGAVFRLYKVDASGHAEPVTSYTESGTEVTSVTTNASGFAGFSFLEKLKPGETYVLAETDVADGYHETSVYSGGYIGTEKPAALTATTVTVNGKSIPAYVVFTYDESENGKERHKQVDIYNLPKSTLLILKYDYDYPQLKIPVNAQFTLKKTDKAYPGDVDVQVRVSTSKAARPETVEAFSDLYGYSSAGKYYFTDDSTDYSFVERYEDLIPGTYTVTETEAATYYFYTPQAGSDDPWYPVREVTIDDDGGFSVVKFANIPNPKFNNLNIVKTVSKVKGNAEDGGLGNMQELNEDGTRQSVTYTISDFAPCAGADGILPEAVRYPMNTLYLVDQGLTFEDSRTTAVTNVEFNIDSITVGKANYTDTPAASMLASIYLTTAYKGADTVWTLFRTVDVGSGNETVAVPAEDGYVAFRIVYGEALSRIEKNFKAAPVSVTYSMLQTDDAEQDLVAKVINNASATMGYDIGIADTDEVTFTISSEAKVEAEHTIKMPSAAVTKQAQVENIMGWSEPASGTVQIEPESNLIYTLTFTNLDEELSIPNPFILDVLPDCIDVSGASVAKMDGLSFSDVVVSGRQVYVKGTGELKPGKSVVLTINGTINTPLAMEATTILNSAYAGSTTVLGKNKQNPYGAPFFTDGGGAASYEAPADSVFADLAVVTDKLYHTFVSGSSLSIYKMVAGEVTGSENFMSGYEFDHVAITNSKGNVYYKIIVTTANTILAGQLRVADIIPWVGSGEKSINGSQRYSNLALSDPTITAVTVNGVSVDDYTVQYSTSKDPQTYRDLLTAESFSAGGSSAGASGFCLQVNSLIEGTEAKPGKVIIYMTCKAPAAIETVNGTTVFNYFKWAVNTVSACSRATVHAAEAKSGSKQLNAANEPEVLTSHSNPCCVTILPDQDAAIGDRIWLDKNMNGIQDPGEPDFPYNVSLSLHAYKNSSNPTAIAEVTVPDGSYGFSNLSTGLLTSKDADAYDASGNAKNGALQGDIKYRYQLVADIPDGFYVSPAYAGNTDPGTPTTFGVKEDENMSKVLVWDGNTSDGSLTDSDFVADGNGRYVSRIFYLPMQTDSNGNYVHTAQYMNFDLGLWRVRGLEIIKKGVDNSTKEMDVSDLPGIEGVSFKIYGPYDEPKFEPGEGEKPFDTITTNADGIAVFTSTEDHYLEYYKGYLIVEDDDEWPENTSYAADIFSVKSDSGNAVLPAENGNGSKVFWLAPATDEQDARIEKVTVTDAYHAKGTVGFNLKKNLKNGNITTSEFFKNGAFTFTLSSKDDTQNFGENRSSITLVNDGTDIVVPYEQTPNRKPMLSFDFPLGLPVPEKDGEEPKVEYHYTIKENAFSVTDSDKKIYKPKAIEIDPTIIEITLTITDPDHDGKLHFAAHMQKKELVSSDPEPIFVTKESAALKLEYIEEDKYWTWTNDTTASASLNNTLLCSNLLVTKKVTGTPASESETFPIDVTLTAEAGLEPLINGATFKYVSSKEPTVEKSVTFDDKGKATFDLSSGETVEIKDLPVNTGYTVTEQDVSKRGYTTTYTGETGTIKKDTAAEATVTNDRSVGTLTVSKTVIGNAAEQNREFSFTVTLKAREDKIPLDDQYSYTKKLADSSTQSGTLAFVPDEDGNYVSEPFTLKNGESLTVLNILTDTEYLVHEEDYTEHGYVTEGNDAKGTVTASDSKVSITNERSMGALSVTKKLSGNAANKLKEYVFTVTLENKDGLPVAGEYLCTRTDKNGAVTEGTILFTAKENGTASATFSLAGGETILVLDILKNTVYTVHEEDYRASGYTTKMTGETGTVAEDKTSEAVCTNTRNAGSLTIKKIVIAQGMGIPTDRKFTFTVSLDLPNGAPFTGTLKGVDQNGGTHNIAFVNGVATVKLAHDESMRIEDILVDSEYSVKETAETDVISTESSGTGGIMTTEGASASFTNTLRQEYTSLSFRKEFAKDQNSNKRPGSVTVRVSNRDKVIGTYELNEENGWEQTLNDLPKYDANGMEYTYTVLEVSVPKGYKAVYTMKDGTVVITNILRGNPFEQIEDPDIPLGAGMVMNEGYCFE